MQPSQKGLNFIKSYEGCVLHPYLDQGGIPTIGYGMTYYPDTDKHVKMTDPVLTQAQADSLFLLMVKPYADAVLEATSGVLLNQNQLDALTSFTYNCGIGAFQQSTLCQHVLLNKVTEADFTLYDHVGKQVLVGLLKRREAEYQLFITSIVPIITNQNKTMKTTWVKFYDSATKTVNTVFVADQVFQKDGQTFDFTDANDMLSKSTNETFNFWDGETVGAGQVIEGAGLSA